MTFVFTRMNITRSTSTHFLKTIRLLCAIVFIILYSVICYYGLNLFSFNVIKFSVHAQKTDGKVSEIVHEINEKNDNVFTKKENNGTRISHLYSDLGLRVYGQWQNGFRHDRPDFDSIKQYFGRCKHSESEKPLHFEFYDQRLNEINVTDRLRHILKEKKLLFVGDSVMRDFFHGICILLRWPVNKVTLNLFHRSTIFSYARKKEKRQKLISNIDSTPKAVYF